MTRLRVFLFRLRALVRSRQMDRAIDDEIASHLAEATDEYVRQGLSPEEARVAARRGFGGVTQVKEVYRQVGAFGWLHDLRQDVRYALRTLRRSAAFTTVAVLTLALGIGANTAIFSVVNAVFLQPLGYPRPEQLRFLTTGSREGGRGAVSPAEYIELTGITQSFSVIGAFAIGEVNLSARDRPRRATRATVNAELLEALAVPALHGRWFRREETRAHGPALVILSYELWRSAFAAQKDMVGQLIEIDGVRREVIGVMPPGFDLMDQRVELLLPLQLDFPALRQFRASHFLSVLGRLRDGVTPEHADAELASLSETWSERTGATGHVFTPGAHILQMDPVLEAMVGPVRRTFWMLQAVVGLVLLIACVNLANLLMVRAEVRRREIAVRRALGAGRRRLLAQFAAEGLVLSALGGALGLAMAWTGVNALKITYPDSLPRVADITINPAVLGLTVLASLTTGVVFALAPLRYLTERAAGSLLNDSTRGTSSAGFGLRRALVAGEVALAVVLVAGAGLMLRTVVNLMSVDAGFERSRLVTFGVALPAATYRTVDQRVQLQRRLSDRLGAIPGIDGVSAVSGLPPQRGRNNFGTDIEAYSPPPEVSNWVNYYQTVTHGYFETMGIPILRGRAFERTDSIGAPVAVVNEAFARTFWKGLDPIGRRVRPRFGDHTPWVTVIGVAKDVKQAGLDQAIGTELYFLLDQLSRIFPTIPADRLGNMLGDGSMNIVLRSALPAATLQPSIADAVREADPSLPIIRLRNMDDVFRDSVRRPRMLMQLLAGFAGLALLLAAVGTYGVLSYMVTQRRREIGIQMALGAARSNVLRAVIGQGLTLTCLGLVAGLAAALVLTRFMEKLLFEVRPSDPATLAGVSALIAATAAAASLIPAVRATHVDPIVALREEP